MRLDRLVKTALAALEDVKAKDVVVLDVTRLTSLFDRMIIASGDSTRQIRALSINLQEKVKALGAAIQGVEGERAGEWVLVDLGSVVVHIMLPAARAYYRLEELWGGQKTRSKRHEPEKHPPASAPSKNV